MDPNGGLQKPIGKKLQEGWTMARQAGPISAGSFIRLGSRTIQHHHNVFGLGRKHQRHTRQCWMKSHTVNMGQGAQRAPCGKKWRDPTTLSFHQHVPMTCWTITICPRSCSTGKIHVASAHVPPNCRVLCRKQWGEKAHLQISSKQEAIWKGTHHLSDWFSIIHLWSIHWSS